MAAKKGDAPKYRVGLFTTLPDAERAGVEPADGQYRRMPLPAAVVAFPEAGEDWGQLQGVGLFLDGTLVLWAALDEPVRVTKGHSATITLHWHNMQPLKRDDE